MVIEENLSQLWLLFLEIKKASGNQLLMQRTGPYQIFAELRTFEGAVTPMLEGFLLCWGGPDGLIPGPFSQMHLPQMYCF